MDASIEGEETLEKLLQASKSAEGRSLLRGTLAALVRRLSTILPVDLLPVLRILRNLCAGEAANQNAFLHLGGPAAIEALLFSPLANLEVRRVGLQLLGNFALAGGEHRAAVWESFYPARFLELATMREPRVCDPLCMVLDTCCSSEGGRRRVEELCDNERGLPIVVEIIKTACTGGYREEWPEWLLAKLCIEEPYFLLLFQNLASSMHDYGDHQAFLLQLLSKCLSNRPGDIILSKAFSLGILKILNEASNVVAHIVSRVSSSLPTSSPTIDVLGYSLVILRDSCAWEDPSLAAAADSLVDSLVSNGLMELVLCILEELGPPSSVKRATENSKSLLCPQCPYRGFRRDLVSVVGNCLHRRKHVQDQIRERNAIPLLLQQCVVDDDNPFLREWGLFAVRNLLEDNEENQHYVAELRLQESVNTPEILGLGLRVELDGQSGRPKLVNIS